MSLYKSRHKRRLNSRRGRVRDRYVKSLDSAYTNCNVCNVRIVWIQKLPTEDYELVNERIAFIIKENVEVFTGTVDHIIRIADGGTDDLDNLTGLCWECHSKKDGWHRHYCTKCLRSVDEYHVCISESKPLSYSLGDKLKELFDE